MVRTASACGAAGSARHNTPYRAGGGGGPRFAPPVLLSSPDFLLALLSCRLLIRDIEWWGEGDDPPHQTMVFSRFLSVLRGPIKHQSSRLHFSVYLFYFSSGPGLVGLSHVHRADLGLYNENAGGVGADHEARLDAPPPGHQAAFTHQILRWTVRSRFLISRHHQVT